MKCSKWERWNQNRRFNNGRHILLYLYILVGVHFTVESASCWYILVPVPWSTERNTFEMHLNRRLSVTFS